ncbi:MAG: histidinol dehydrogenase [bacterium]
MLKEINNLERFIKEREALLEQHTDPELYETLNNIKKSIREEKDKALITYTKKFDHIDLDITNIKVTPNEIQNAYNHVSKNYLSSLKNAIENIKNFHHAQLPKNWQSSPSKDLSYALRYLPLNSVALYVPGGRNPYPSSVIMNAIPAIIAGVKHPIILSPPNQEKSLAPSILVAADLCGITDIYKIGGAQAIFAAAYGTESIPQVDKITGPGNRYVTSAKQMVYGKVDIDKPAGPSEVLVYIDTNKYAHFAAAELLAQMEHDPLASAILITTNEKIATTCRQEFKKQLKTCKRHPIITNALNQSAYIIEENSNKAIDIMNKIASEHVVLISEHAQKLSKKLTNGASLFLGPYSPVALGDYFSGPNHVLPTNSCARFASPLGVLDFMKYRYELSANKNYIKENGQDIITLATQEKLDAHANSVKIRST